ncbi:hypothetical protein ABZ726_08485 [Streptomyces hundungensis]|uniref:hypothetical protein n=1 Tax=Streptomyces hundungensis TaxID=1077946 RepID=UPI0033C903D6
MPALWALRAVRRTVLALGPSAADRAWLVAQFPAPLKCSALACAGIFSPSGPLRCSVRARAGHLSLSGD